MIRIFIAILRFLNTIINFLFSTIQSLWMLIYYVPSYVEFLIDAVSVLPAVLIPFIVASITIYAVLFVLGRDSS